MNDDGAVMVADAPGTAAPLQPQERCQFSLITEKPSIRAEGPDDVMRLIKVLEQPDSPVVLTSLDVRRPSLLTSPSQYTMAGMISVEVMNISDASISRVEIGRVAGWTDGHSSGRWSFGTTLNPGAREVFSFSGRSGGATAHPGDLTVLLGVDAAFFGDCRYEPSVTPAGVMRAGRKQ